MRVVAAVLMSVVLAGCTSVKMVQRDGCWVRRTEKRGLGTVTEEVGPCARPATAFVENDSLTRMVQECIARADYRWQMRAIAAWDRREPWPEQLTESSVLQQCMDDAAKGVLGEAAMLKEKNAALEQRLAALAKEHDALKRTSEEERKELVRRSDDERKAMMKRSDEERKQLVALQSKLGEHLGAAAKKVQPLPKPSPAIATATATSEGRSRTDATREAQAQPATLAVVTTPAGTPAACIVAPDGSARADAPANGAAPARQARAPRRAREAPKAALAAKDLPACDPSKTPGVPASVASTPKITDAPTVGPATPQTSGPPAAAVPAVVTPAAASPAVGSPEAAAQAR